MVFPVKLSKPESESLSHANVKQFHQKSYVHLYRKNVKPSRETLYDASVEKILQTSCKEVAKPHSGHRQTLCSKYHAM